MIARAQPVADVPRGLLELGQVLADAEGAARARHDDGAHRGISGVFESCGELLVHRPGECIEDVGAVERDRQDRAVEAGLHLRHRTSDSRRSRRSTLTDEALLAWLEWV